MLLIFLFFNTVLFTAALFDAHYYIEHPDKKTKNEFKLVYLLCFGYVLGYYTGVLLFKPIGKKE